MDERRDKATRALLATVAALSEFERHQLLAWQCGSEPEALRAALTWQARFWEPGPAALRPSWMPSQQDNPADEGE